MAEEIIFKVGVNTGNTSKDLNNIDKELKSISNTAKDISNIDSRFDELNKKVASGTLTMRESTKAIKEYQTIALQAGAESPIGQAAIANAAKLTDELGDLKNAITNASHDGANMQAALQLGSGIAAGYGVMQGTMALLGSESEDLQKTFVKLQAVQAVLAGIESIRASLEKESFMMQKAKIIGTKIMTGVEVIYAAAVGGTTGAMKLARLAMLALPIVAIIAGVIALADAMGAFGDATDEAAEKQANFLKQQKQRSETYGKILDEDYNKFKEKSDNELALMKAKGATDEALFKKERSNLDFRLDMLKFASIKNKEQVAEMRAVKQELLLLEANHTREIEENNKKKTNSNKKHLDDTNKNGEEADQLRKDRTKLIEDFMVQSIDDENVRKLAVLQLAHRREQEELVTKFGNDTTLIAELTYKQSQELAVLNAEIAKAEEDAKIASNEKKIADAKILTDLENKNKKAQLEGELIAKREDFDSKQLLEAELALLERDQALQNKELTKGEEFKIEEEYQQKLKDLKVSSAEHDKQIHSDAVTANLQTTEMGLNAIQNLSDIFFTFKSKNLKKGSVEELAAAKKQFQVNKAMQLANATITGVQSVMAAFQNGMKNPVPLLGPATAGIYAAAAGIGAAANIAKISATKFEGGGGGSMSMSSVSAPSIPNTPIPEADTTATAGLVGGGQNKQASSASKVYVLDSDITQVQQKTEKAQALATQG